MIHGSIESRARRVFLLLILLLGGLIARVGYIQLVRGGEFAARAHRTHFKDIPVLAPRGRILDRHGRMLAGSYHAKSIAVNPQRIDEPDVFAAEFALLVEDPSSAPAIAQRIREKREAGRRFVYLRRCVDRDLAARVAAAGLPGLDIREEPRRENPHGPTAAAVIGVVGADAHGRVVGLSGLERLFDRALRGVDGCCPVFLSGKRESIHLYPDSERAPQPGLDLSTTLDLVIQQIVEENLDAMQERFEPRASCAVVLDARTGEVLALAGRPGFDPDDFPHVDPEQLRIPGARLVYEPGSTVKPLIMARALAEGAVHRGQIIDCGPGHKRFGGRTLRDVKPNGVLPLQRVLIKSSNIGMAQVGQALGMTSAFRYLHELGFGRRTGVEIEGEETGKITPWPKWHPNYTLVSVSMGHELMVTPLQLAAAYAALVTDGRLRRPSLRLGAPRGPSRSIGIDRASIAFIRETLERVVDDPRGTGRRARVPGLRIGGKTGTSEKYPEGQSKYFSSFIGFAPADDPHIVVLVVADEPRRSDGLKPYGGVVAAPVVGEIIRRSLPLLDRSANVALPESGVRHLNQETRQGKVRVAAVNRSSVWVGEGDFPTSSRNPDSVGAVGAEACRSDGR